MRAPLVAALWASAASASSWGLYADSPHVVELPGTLPWWADSDAQGCPYVVVFYASWCGHCRHYAPTYKAVAEEMERLGNPYGLAALDCAEYTDYCDKMGIRSFPTVVHYPTGSGTQTDTGGEVKLKGRDADAVSVRRLVRTAFSAGAAPARPSLSEAGWRTCRESRGRLRLLRKSPPHPPANAQLPASALARVWLSDLVQATHVALSDEAVAAGCLQDPQRRAVLADFVRLCASAFPHAETRAQLASLPQLLSDPNVPVDRVQWRSAVAFLSPPGVRWEGCRGSSQSYRGYTCGLWQVYHALLANTASGEKVRALNVISRWVLATFGCEVCRKHFERESASIAEVTTDDAAVLWLWRDHNSVNFRLRGAPSDDPAAPKQMWPSRELCGDCSAGDTFDEQRVLAFLRRFYGAESVHVGRSEDAAREESSGLSTQTRFLMAAAAVAVALLLVNRRTRALSRTAFRRLSPSRTPPV
eukprot:TRINITY_DN20103_c0_g1_i2.p1 TRINITY_DN20103_c0_g1~~TRINITY_DN20103_c0_g1_i2.p1  ORF type:complete len:487 (+),score=119.82 TRINITY_DN20103_c0_g1_i2:40-1461(+)